MKNTISINFTEEYCVINFQVIKSYVSDEETLFSSFSGLYNSLDELIKYLNKCDYNVDIQIKRNLNNQFTDFIGDVKPGEYKLNGKYIDWDYND